MRIESWSRWEYKTLDPEARVIRGWATTPQTDRMDDIVEPRGAKFSLPMNLLRGHDQERPIGHVIKADVSDEGIEVTAQISKPGVPFIDETWELMSRHLLSGLSIGFKSIDDEAIKGSPWGRRFKQWEWLELSVVTVAANAGASITSIKALDRQQMRAATGNAPLKVVRLSSPQPGDTGSNRFVIKRVHVCKP